MCSVGIAGLSPAFLLNLYVLMVRCKLGGDVPKCIKSLKKCSQFVLVYHSDIELARTTGSVFTSALFITFSH